MQTGQNGAYEALFWSSRGPARKNRELSPRSSGGRALVLGRTKWTGCDGRLRTSMPPGVGRAACCNYFSAR